MKAQNEQSMAALQAMLGGVPGRTHEAEDAQVSEFLGEARVVIRPDTTRFRAELQAQVLVAARGVTVPVKHYSYGCWCTGMLLRRQPLSRLALEHKQEAVELPRRMRTQRRSLARGC